MKNKLIKLIDLGISPFVLFSAILMKRVRILQSRLPVSKKILLKVGVQPIRNHYYEPFFSAKQLRKALSEERTLLGIDWNLTEQLDLLNSFDFQHEFENMPDNFIADTVFHFNNRAFGSGDAEFWYNIIRLKKPKKIIEIGSGNSTLMARLAIQKNQDENTSYQCEHICIEPYEMPWLEKTGVKTIRKKVEDMDVAFFGQLEANDILFIDSSHVIRPQGDVLFEYLEILPTLKSGVIVHVHDIFSPHDYPYQWLLGEIRLWNEQYLLEAFLSYNSQWKIIGAVNLLKNNHFEILKTKCPRIDTTREPGSFYIIKH
ncbi:MAG: class I SAM-dependent methyltransferase [Bacteroidales bacterium]|jgi:hypothetical protein|nr:class I SAM-dependent methyltransferase [Bacteroidales bacterium]